MRVVFCRSICAVHHRLGEGRLVGFVVAVAAVADDVEHDVGAEQMPELSGHPRTEHHRVQIVTVDMQIGTCTDFAMSVQ